MIVTFIFLTLVWSFGGLVFFLFHHLESDSPVISMFYGMNSYQLAFAALLCGPLASIYYFFLRHLIRMVYGVVSSFISKIFEVLGKIEK